MNNKLRVDVVMLFSERGMLFMANNDICIKQKGDLSDKYFHLYLTSSEEIKIGDWILPNGTPHKVLEIKGSDYKTELCWISNVKKVVATTDPSLGLPIIPQSFIEEYVEKQGKIKQVYIKVTDYKNEGKLRPRLIDDFNVIILPIKDSWNREEVREMIKKLSEANYSGLVHYMFIDWFDKNY